MIKIGDVLFLEPKYTDQYEKYKCKVVELQPGKVYIDYPMNLQTKRTVFLLDGSQLKASFSTESSVFMFDTEITGRVKQQIPMMVLSYPGNDHLIKIQRREFVRVEMPLDVAVHSLNNEVEPFTTITDDISAGGAALLVPKKLSFKEGSILQTWFVLPMQSGEYYYLKLNSEVIRLVGKNDLKNKLSVRFDNISDHDRQLLLRFCFESQVVMRKKGIDS